MTDLIVNSYSASVFSKDANAIVDLISEHLNNSSTTKTLEWMTPEEQLEFWKKDFNSVSNTDPLTLFSSVIKHSINIHNPKYLGHQVSASLPLTVISSAVIAYLNQSLPVYEMGMVGNALEKIITGHLIKKLKFGEEASGIITSGGTMANLTALLSARSDFDEKDYHNLVVFVSGEAHYSIERAAKIMGLPVSNVIKVPVDDNFQLKTELLDDLYEKSVSAGKKVLCIVGCACSTALGVYDDLNAIGNWAHKNKVWFHVDGAHGAAVVYSPKYEALLNGIDKADSVILDFHKLLMVSSVSTALLYKNGVYAKKTFAQKADYLFGGQEQDDWYNSGKTTFECTKPMHILNTYAILRIYGETIYEQNIDRLYGLAEEFANIIQDNGNFELAIRPQSNIVCFRCKEVENSDEINRDIAEKLLHDGTFFIVSTVIKGEFWFRVSIQNPLTTIDDLKALLDHIWKIRKEIS